MVKGSIPLLIVVIYILFFLFENYASFFSINIFCTVYFNSLIFFIFAIELFGINLLQKLFITVIVCKFYLRFFRIGWWGTLFELNIQSLGAPFRSRKIVSGILIVQTDGFFIRNMSNPENYDVIFIRR